MPLAQQAKEGIMVLAGIIDPDYQVEIGLLFQNGGGLPGIWTLLLLEISHKLSEWQDSTSHLKKKKKNWKEDVFSFLLPGCGDVLSLGSWMPPPGTWSLTWWHKEPETVGEF